MFYKCLVNVNHDNVTTPAGGLIELTDGEAQPLLDCKAIEPSQKRFGRAIVVPGTTNESTGNQGE